MKRSPHSESDNVSDMAASLLDDCLIMLSGRMQSGLQTFAFLDLPGRVETFGLLSFCCCMLGSLGEFPLSANLGVALLALVACRSKSEAQCLCVCGASMFTILTDFFFITSNPSAWGTAMAIINAALKLGCANNAYKLCSSSQFGGDELSQPEEGFPRAYHAPPLQSEDYAALAADAASKHSGIGDATQYRAI